VADDVSPVRAEVVRVLADVDFTKPLDSAEAEWLLNSTAAERRQVGGLHGRLADLEYARAAALFRALTLLRPWWVDRDTRLVDVLKVCPSSVAADVVQVLRDTGWLVE